jgi:hypothetical protein
MSDSFAELAVARITWMNSGILTGWDQTQSLTLGDFDISGRTEATV